MELLKKKYIGDRAFYRRVLAIALPVIIQNGISNTASLLDNIMVGRIGTEPMSGVAIAGQLTFVFFLSIFGAMSGPGIFGAQYAGARDVEGVRNTFRLKLILAAVISVGGCAIFALFDDPLISLYLSENDTPAAIAATLEAAKVYLAVIVPGLPVAALTQAYASTLREWGETMLPMRAGVVSVFVNLVFNWLLIFGNLGFPEWGVAGAAAATTLSRIVELGLILIVAYRHKADFPFLEGLYSSFKVPAELVKQVALKGAPLLANECLWSVGKTSVVQAYATRGLMAMAAMNICSTVANLFNVFYMSIGTAVSILLGQTLGTGDMEQAKDSCRKLTALATFTGLCVGVLVMLVAPMITGFYNTEQAVKDLAATFLRCTALAMPLFGFVNSSYFTLRSGGKTGVTFLFDCGFTWLIELPCAFVLARYTGLDVGLVYLCVQMTNLIKVALGGWLVGKGVWLKRIV